MTYDGLPTELRDRVKSRDAYRCRWCGSTNQGVDLHHIRYRRGDVDDVLENLVSLCRRCHGFVHGTRNRAGRSITKSVAQMVLFWVIDHPGTIGSGRWSAVIRQWTLAGLCTQHGEEKATCPDCPAVS